MVWRYPFLVMAVLKSGNKDLVGCWKWIDDGAYFSSSRRVFTDEAEEGEYFARVSITILTVCAIFWFLTCGQRMSYYSNQSLFFFKVREERREKHASERRVSELTGFHPYARTASEWFAFKIYSSCKEQRVVYLLVQFRKLAALFRSSHGDNSSDHLSLAMSACCKKRQCSRCKDML